MLGNVAGSRERADELQPLPPEPRNRFTMATDAQPHETDDRFPTGEWKGFYLQPDSRQRHWMELCLHFAEQRITGAGDDPVGEFRIRGEYDTATGVCTWTKQYVGQHCVAYAGRACRGGILGNWRIRGLPALWNGPFFIWPRAYGDLEAAFERAFVEQELDLPFPEVPAEEELATEKALGGRVARPRLAAPHARNGGGF